MDKNLFDFVNLKPTGIADEDGDKAFDQDNFADYSPLMDDDEDTHDDNSTTSPDNDLNAAPKNKLSKTISIQKLF